MSIKRKQTVYNVSVPQASLSAGRVKTRGLHDKNIDHVLQQLSTETYIYNLCWRRRWPLVCEIAVKHRQEKVREGGGERDKMGEGVYWAPVTTQMAAFHCF